MAHLPGKNKTHFAPPNPQNLHNFLYYLFLWGYRPESLAFNERLSFHFQGGGDLRIPANR
ncbi:hypothetical protein UR09_00120 [Candidatus Nitromaritima sp. SCGC AAA799-A02]|nr:hypothetical protein UR09_00120 [Candidatus Nitromaritima sp. SCGC AAA799-A02]